jgi:LuxR family maltose regulon positive regulatory protein
MIVPGDQASPTLPGDLTELQVRVLRLLRGSLTLTEIATELSLSPNTIKTHTQAIYRKLGVCTREDAVNRGLDQGILRSPIRSGSGIGQTAVRPAQSR